MNLKSKKSGGGGPVVEFVGGGRAGLVMPSGLPQALLALAEANGAERVLVVVERR